VIDEGDLSANFGIEMASDAAIAAPTKPTREKTATKKKPPIAKRSRSAARR